MNDHKQLLSETEISENDADLGASMNENKPFLLATDMSKRAPNLDIIPLNIRKRRSISVKEKLDILNMVDSGCKLSAVARNFGISSSTASTIVKERHKIKLLFDHYNIDPHRKRMRLGIFRDVDEAVHLWFRQMKMKNVVVNGPMLQQKAREFALQLGHQNFEGSSGWLFRFRERHGLSVKNMRENDDNPNACSGVGMTDEEIVTSVSLNAVHTLSPTEKEKTKVKNDIPENFLVPEIEFNESRSELSELVNLLPDDLHSKNMVNYNNRGVIEFNASKPSVSCDRDLITHAEPYEYVDSATDASDSSLLLTLHEAVCISNKLIEFLKEHDTPQNVLDSMNTVNNFIDNDLREQMKQTKITDYFKI